jgi:Methyltransferase domain
MSSTSATQHCNTIVCRFCEGRASLAFTAKVRKRYDVGYYQCAKCESLLTEPPTWLDESYSDPVRPHDVDRAARVERCRFNAFWLWKLFRFTSSDRLLDWGGGEGLLVRKLRDDGIDAYIYDLYCHNSYAIGFEGSPDQQYEVLTSFEVLEHLVDARGELEQMFACQPKVFLLSSGFYRGQDENWSYLFPTTGQHVFFWSPKALRMAGEMFGYQVVVGGSLALFYRPGMLGPFRRRLLRLIVSYHGMRTKQLLWLFWPKRSLQQKDRESISSRFDTNVN